jgi:hypothetical protein
LLGTVPTVTGADGKSEHRPPSHGPPPASPPSLVVIELRKITLLLGPDEPLKLELVVEPSSPPPLALLLVWLNPPPGPDVAHATARARASPRASVSSGTCLLRKERSMVEHLGA